MAKFSEVLGGIAKDLIQIQVTSDLASMDILSQYKEKDFLKYLEIPRFSVSDIKLNLKFAVNEQESIEQTGGSVKYADNEWIDLLKKDVLTRFPFNFSNLSENDKRAVVTEFDKIVKETTVPNLKMNDALNGNTAPTISQSVIYAVSIYNKLPVELRTKLGNVNEFRKKITTVIETTLNEKLSVIKKVASSKAALERDLEIIIEKDSLEKIPESKIHEISFNLTPDFIKIIQGQES